MSYLVAREKCDGFGMGKNWESEGGARVAFFSFFFFQINKHIKTVCSCFLSLSLFCPSLTSMVLDQ